MKGLVDILQKWEAQTSDAVFVQGEASAELSELGATVFSCPEKTLGYCLGGYRTAFIWKNEPDHFQKVIQKAADLHLPVVFWLPEGVQDLISGSLIWSVANAESFWTIGLMAHRSSELSMMPSVILYNPEATLEEIQVDSSAGFLGKSSSLINNPSPAQEFVFGKVRPLQFPWFSLNEPRMLNAPLSDEENYTKLVSGKIFIQSHVPEILHRVQKEFKETFNREFDWFDIINDKKSKSVVFCQDSSYYDIMNSLPRKGEAQPIVAHGKLISPFLSEEFAKILPPSADVTWAMKRGNRVSSLQHSPPYSKLGYQWKQWVITDHPDEEELTGQIQKILDKKPQNQLFQHIEVLSEPNQSPKREILNDFLTHTYGEWISKNKIAEPGGEHAFQGEHPLLQNLNNHGGNSSSLSDFLPYVLSEYRTDNNHKFQAQPHRAFNFVPSMSSLTRTYENEREIKPEWEQKDCTACGMCFNSCSYSAIVPASFTWEDFLKNCLTLAEKEGGQVTPLRPLLKSLSKALYSAVSEMMEEDKELMLLSVWDKAVENYLGNTSLDENKQQEVRSALSVLANVFPFQKIAATELLYNEMEAYKSGTGEMFHLAIDPFACSGCGKCMKACPEDALKMVLEEESTETSSVEKVMQFQNTSPDTLQYLLQSHEISPFDAIRMKKDYFSTVHSATKETRLHRELSNILMLARNEAERKSAVYLDQVNDSISSMEEHIHDLLEQSIPDTDFSEIKKTIQSKQSHRIHVGELIGNGVNTTLNKSELERKLNLLETLKRLQKNIKEGYSGDYRLNYAIVENLGRRGRELFRYPVNPFPVPVFSRGSLNIALGIQRNLFSKYLDELKLMKRAKLEVRNNYHPVLHEEELKKLGWESLSAEEKQNAPSVIYFEGGKCSASHHAQALSGWKLPFRYIHFSLASEIKPDTGYEILDISMKTKWNAYQGVFGLDNILFKHFTAFFSENGPAFFNVMSFDDQFLQYNSPKDEAILALASRAWPLFRAEVPPESSFPLIRLEGNPSLKSDFHETENGDPLTWANFAVRLKKYEDQFEEKEEVGEKTIVGPSGDRFYRFDERIARENSQVIENWRALKRLAGYTHAVSEELKDELKKENEERLKEELTKLKNEYLQKFDHQKQEVRQQLKQKLMAIALRKQK